MRGVKTKKVLVINKVDLVDKSNLLVLMDEMNQKSLFEEIIPISALKEDGLDQLKSLILNYLPEGPEYFPKGMVTDCPETFLFGLPLICYLYYVFFHLKNYFIIN